jgi:hypothetical protein
LPAKFLDSSIVTAPEVIHRLEAAFNRFLEVYSRFGGHRYYGWDDYPDPRNFKGPTFWSENDCTYRLGLELEKEFPYSVHYELPVAKWSFFDFDKTVDRQQRIDLVVSDLHEFVEDETSQERFQQRQHELFVEVKYLPAGCRKTYRFDHVSKVPGAVSDAERLSQHIVRKHCTAAAVLVVDDDGLFEEVFEPATWPVNVALLLASPQELERRAQRRTGGRDAARTSG